MGAGHKSGEVAPRFSEVRGVENPSLGAGCPLGGCRTPSRAGKSPPPRPAGRSAEGVQRGIFNSSHLFASPLLCPAPSRDELLALSFLLMVKSFSISYSSLRDTYPKKMTSYSKQRMSYSREKMSYSKLFASGTMSSVSCSTVKA